MLIAKCPNDHTMKIKSTSILQQAGEYWCQECGQSWVGQKLQWVETVPDNPAPRDPLLVEREKTHGDFAVTAAIIQALKNVMRDTPNWRSLSTAHREALEMNAHKIGRILSGDPSCKEHWVDIGGYAKLGAEACK